MRGFKKIILLILTMVLLIPIACEIEESAQESGEKEQESIMQRARAQEPTYIPQYFLTRKYVNKWMETMDVPNKLFYIYVMADNGSFVGYYVAQYRPVSTATFLTPTKQIAYRGNYGVAILPSNALDGTYYGSGGASDQYFWYDAETGAFIEIKGLNYILQDQPLAVDVPRLKIEVIE